MGRARRWLITRMTALVVASARPPRHQRELSDCALRRRWLSPASPLLARLGHLRRRPPSRYLITRWYLLVTFITQEECGSHLLMVQLQVEPFDSRHTRTRAVHAMRRLFTSI